MKFLLLLLLISFSFPDEFIENLIKKLDERGKKAWWWDEKWWKEGYIEPVPNYKVKVEWVSVYNGDVEIPVMVARPEKEGKFPGVLFLHGRRGLDELFQLHVIRLAARGFVVVAPDLYTGRFIERFPIYHDPIVEDDANVVLDYALSRKDIDPPGKVCVYGLTRGGFYALRLLVAKGRQVKDIVCFVGYYPHLQDPNRPEPMQVYRYHEDVEKIKVPVMFFVGREEQYQRLRPALMAIDYLKSQGREAYIVIYPGVGRGFDFRNGDKRKFADDLAAKDAIIRATKFMKKHLKAAQNK